MSIVVDYERFLAGEQWRVTFDKQISCPNLLKGLAAHFRTRRNLKNFESILVILYFRAKLDYCEGLFRVTKKKKKSSYPIYLHN